MNNSALWGGIIHIKNFQSHFAQNFPSFFVHSDKIPKTLPFGVTFFLKLLLV